jgi:hypothetical protein
MRHNIPRYGDLAKCICKATKAKQEERKRLTQGGMQRILKRGTICADIPDHETQCDERQPKEFWL